MNLLILSRVLDAYQSQLWLLLQTQYIRWLMGNRKLISQGTHSSGVWWGHITKRLCCLTESSLGVWGWHALRSVFLGMFIPSVWTYSKNPSKPQNLFYNISALGEQIWTYEFVRLDWNNKFINVILAIVVGLVLLFSSIG